MQARCRFFFFFCYLCRNSYSLKGYLHTESSITLAFVPGRDFTVSLERPYKTGVQVTKVFHTPILKLLSAQKAVTANPFLAEEIPMTLESHIPVQNDLTVHLASTGLVLGQDLYVKGAEAATLVLSAWWSSPSEQFMQGFDTEKFDVSQENGLWKVQYKLCPR